jgi:alginate O-acetyltransferase complex protein AlgI
MIFSSAIFVYAFLPLFLAAYYLVPQRARGALILLASCVFYGWWKVEYLVVVLGLAGVSFAAARLAIEARRPGVRLWAVRGGVSINLATLGYFKYSYFLTDNFNTVLAGIGLDHGDPIALILPIGISFLTFQSISYILDVARKDAPPARNLIDFLAFSTLFPQLIAGPVLRYKDLADQFETREHSLATFAAGVRRFVTGLAMKLLVADSVAPLADRIFALDAPTMAEAWLGGLAYSIQLFFDFAGYSAMAIGLGLMIGFRFVENFNAPYSSRSITEFWQRWHISLSNWLRDYLYVPLGGNRGGAWRTYRNLMLTMVLGGFWHGANWTFVLWGLWHGGLMAIERRLGAKSRASVWPRLIAWPLTMVFVLIGWVMFRATTVTEAFAVYAGMIGRNGFAFTPETLILTQSLEFVALGAGCLLSVGPWQRVNWPTLPRLAAAQPVLLFCLCALVMSARSHSPFLYFQF